VRLVAVALLVMAVGPAVAVLPGIAAQASTIALRSPLELRQLVGNVGQSSCPAGTVTVPVAPPSPVCVSHTGMTITVIESAAVQKERTYNVPVSLQKKYHLPATASFYGVRVQLTPSAATQLLALTRRIYRQPRPGDELGAMVGGHFLGSFHFGRPYAGGVLTFEVGPRAEAESLLSQLLHG
jgi:hypothetical protein